MSVRRCLEGGLFVRSRPASTLSPAIGPLVWIHGLGESGLCFEGIVSEPELAPFGHIIPDLPGYGRTEPSATPIDLAHLADRLATWLEARGSAPVVAIGHSMGGVVALLLAERHPGLLSALIDIEGNKSEGDCVYSGEAIALGASRFFSGGFDAMRARIEAAGAADPALRGYAASLELCDGNQFLANARELVELSRGEGLAARLATISLPKLYVAGVPRGVSSRSRELVAAQGVPMIAIGDCGHWPFVDESRRVAAALASFLGETARDRRVAGRPAG